jgi:hypothetical protein
MTKKTQTKTLEQLEAELEAVRAEYSEVNDRLQVIYKEYQNALDAKFEASGDDFDVVEIVMHAHNNSAAHKILDEYARGLGLQMGAGYWGSDDEGYVRVAPRFYLGKDEDVSEVEFGIREFCNRFEGYCEKNGDVFLDFMENTLSERGSYGIIWTPGDDSARLRVMVYGHESEVFSGSLREVLEYVAKHHWYGEPYPDDEEENR